MFCEFLFLILVQTVPGVFPDASNICTLPIKQGDTFIARVFGAVARPLGSKLYPKKSKTANFSVYNFNMLHYLSQVRIQAFHSKFKVVHNLDTNSPRCYGGALFYKGEIRYITIGLQSFSNCFKK